MFSSHFTLLVACFQKSNRNTKFNQITLDETLDLLSSFINDDDFYIGWISDENPSPSSIGFALWFRDDGNVSADFHNLPFYYYDKMGYKSYISRITEHVRQHPNFSTWEDHARFEPKHLNEFINILNLLVNPNEYPKLIVNLPIPYPQLIEFIEWLRSNNILLLQEEIESGTIGQIIRIYILSNLLADEAIGLGTILKIFQVCPMIDENEATEQVRHFCGCGRCIFYIQEKNIDISQVYLHPLLSEFFRYCFQIGLVKEFNAVIPISKSQAAAEMRYEDADEWFQEVIKRFGNRIESALLEFLSHASKAMIRNYLTDRKSHNFNKFVRINSSKSEPLCPINMYDDVEFAAQRLEFSVQQLVENGYYDHDFMNHPNHCHSFSSTIQITDGIPQSLEFLAWINHKYPQLNIIGDIPHSSLKKLIHTFCEEKNYSNADSFSKTVYNWLRGEKDKKFSDRLYRVVSNLLTNRESKNNPETFVARYSNVRFHALFLFLSSDDFPSFIPCFCANSQGFYSQTQTGGISIRFIDQK